MRRWLLQNDVRFPYSSLQGVECHYQPDAEGGALLTLTRHGTLGGRQFSPNRPPGHHHVTPTVADSPHYPARNRTPESGRHPQLIGTDQGQDRTADEGRNGLGILPRIGHSIGQLNQHGKLSMLRDLNLSSPLQETPRRTPYLTCGESEPAAGDLPDAALAIKLHNLCAPAGQEDRALVDILSKVSPGRVSSMCLTTNR
jgi:hypothetical protein